LLPLPAQSMTMFNLYKWNYSSETLSTKSRRREENPSKTNQNTKTYLNRQKIKIKKLIDRYFFLKGLIEMREQLGSSNHKAI
jgi:hypothetical protein